MPPITPCAPHCKVPEKRDFMIINPEKSAADFYANYDPMVGIGTALILLLIILLITAKSALYWTMKRWKKSKCEKIVSNARRTGEASLTTIISTTGGSREGAANALKTRREGEVIAETNHRGVDEKQPNGITV